MHCPRVSAASYAVPALTVALLLTSCSGSTKTPSISLATVGRATVTEVVEAPATVTARASTTLAAPADGTVAALDVRDGQSVAAGTILMRIDSPSAQQRLRDAQSADQQAAAGQVNLPGADLSALQGQSDASAEAAFEAARSEANALPTAALRAAALAQGAAAEQRYAAARAAAAAAIERFNAGIASLSTALSSLASASRVQTHAAVELAQQAVDALVVRTPIAGVVSLGSGSASTGSSLSGALASLPPAVQGQAAQALAGGGTTTTAGSIAVGVPVSSGTPLATVTDTSTLSLRADVDETDVLLVRPGVPARVSLDAVPDASYPASVTGVDLTPRTSAGGSVTYSVRLRLGAGRLGDGSVAPQPRPGMSAVVDLEVRRAVDAIAVPGSAVVQEGTRNAVFLDVGGRASQRYVTLGAQGDVLVQVVAGVRLGDRVVVRGADSVRDGQKLPPE